MAGAMALGTAMGADPAFLADLLVACQAGIAAGIAQAEDVPDAPPRGID